MEVEIVAAGADMEVEFDAAVSFAVTARRASRRGVRVGEAGRGERERERVVVLPACIHVG